MRLRPAYQGILAVLAMPSLGLDAQAPIAAQSPSFTYQRAVIVDSAGWQQLALDPAILAAGAPFQQSAPAGPGKLGGAYDGMRDLRLYEDGGREIPYLLVAPLASVDQLISARPLPITPTRTTSGFELDLREMREARIVHLVGLSAPFLKRVRLEGSGDRLHWTLLVAEGTVFDLPGEGRRQLDLEFTPGQFRYLRLTWDDRSSGRVPLPPAALVEVARFPAIPAVAPRTLSLAFKRKPSEPGVSRYTVRLPGTHLPIAALRLTVADRNVVRDARVFEAQLVNGKVYQGPIGSAQLRRAAGPTVDSTPLQVPIKFPDEDQVELVIYDGDNPPLAITEIGGVFADLPFIFFEARAPGWLWARAGDRTLAAPKYDLEALRDSVGALHLVWAHWGDEAAFTTRPPSVDSLIPRGGAPIDAALFTWGRDIRDRTPGLAVVHLDAAALAHSRLSDLRIVDSSGDQVPYLLEQLDGPLIDTLPPPQRLPRGEKFAREAIVSRYWVRLPFDSLRAAKLVLRTSARVFTRRVRLELPMPEDPKRPRGGVVAGTFDWAHVDPDSPAPPLTLELPVAGRDDYQIVVEEGDNTDLPLERPVLLLPAYQLRFPSDGASRSRLLYGRRDIGAPSYDIALIGPRLLGVPAHEATLAPEGPPVARPTNSMPGRIFWGVLIAAVVVLVVIIARLVGQGPPAERSA